MRRFLLLLLIVTVINAVWVAPIIYEQDDLGDPMFSEFTYSISVDCTAATINLTVMNESNKPVQDAYVYLSYIDFASPLISAGPTDKDGFKLIKLPGDVKLMRGVFVLLMEKHDYRSKEVHFDISPCYSNVTGPTKTPQVPPSPPKQNQTGTNISTPSSNITKNDTLKNNTNATAPGNSPNNNGAEIMTKIREICPLAFGLGILLLFKFLSVSKQR